jgi:hypothetical protein
MICISVTGPARRGVRTIKVAESHAIDVALQPSDKELVFPQPFGNLRHGVAHQFFLQNGTIMGASVPGHYPKDGKVKVRQRKEASLENFEAGVSDCHLSAHLASLFSHD